MPPQLGATDRSWPPSQRRVGHIDGVLPTFLATSELGVFNLILTIVGFTAVYGVLAVIECTLMLQAIRKGPDAVSEMGSFGQFAKTSDAGAIAPAE